MTELKRNFKLALSSLADLLMPRVCVVCGRPLYLQEKHLCTACAIDLPYTRWEKMSHNPMADAVNALIEKDKIGRADDGEFEPYQYACALFYYRGDFVQITRSLKYHNNVACGKYFGDILGARLSDSALYQDVDLIIPVPLHWTRKWKRGINQAEIIARAIGAHFPEAVVDTRILQRTRRTKSQATLSEEQKSANVNGAFRVATNYATKKHRQPKHILLVDDVFTTGSTMNSCRQELRSLYSASCRITEITLAFAG